MAQQKNNNDNKKPKKKTQKTTNQPKNLGNKKPKFPNELQVKMHFKRQKNYRL